MICDKPATHCRCRISEALHSQSFAQVYLRHALTVPGAGAIKTLTLAQLPCSLVVVGVGVKPEVELFKGQLPIADNGGIQVDGNLRPCAPVDPVHTKSTVVCESAAMLDRPCVLSEQQPAYVASHKVHQKYRCHAPARANLAGSVLPLPFLDSAPHSISVFVEGLEAAAG